MSIAVTAEHRELAASVLSWAESLGGLESTRAAEADPAATFAEVWAKAQDMAIGTIGLPEAAGGGGGSLLDVSVALEACAHALLPGAFLGTAVAAAVLGETPAAARLAAGEVIGIGLEPSLTVASSLSGTVDVVLDAPGAAAHLLGGLDEAGAEHWYVVPADLVRLEPAVGLDLTRRVGRVRLDADLTQLVPVPTLDRDLLRRTARDARGGRGRRAGSWCLETAVAYAKVREQFGRPIGQFQASSTCAPTMLETAEAVTARGLGRRPGPRPDAGDDEQWAFAADVAGAVALDGAFAHRAGLHPGARRHRLHLRARRPPLPAPGHRDAPLLGGPPTCAAVAGTPAPRPAPAAAWPLDLEGRDERPCRDPRTSSPRSAALPEAEQRAALVEAGYLDPALAGAARARDADAVEPARDRRGARARPGSRAPTSRSAAGRRRRSSPTAPPSSRSASCARRCSARSPGASSSASPAPAPTWPRCARSGATRDGDGRLAAHRPEGVDLAGPRGRLGDLPGPHRPRRARAPGHHLLPGRHEQRRASTSGRCAR